MLTHLRPAFVLTLAMTLLTGLAYPLAMTGIAGVLTPDTARGSLILRDGQVVGSSLIGQGFAGAGYLHPRPSAAAFSAMPSGASNLGPTSQALRDQMAERRAAWNATEEGPAPLDALTASASGLDPHIAPENARAQVARIAAARGVDPALVVDILARHTEGRWLGLYGAPRVNVLLANLALDEALPMPPAEAN